MKRFVLMSLLLAVVTVVSAVPAKREWRSVSQPDGTSVELMLIGDENFHFFITRDDVPVVENDGAYYYAQAKDNAMVASATLAHEASLRTQDDLQAMSTVDDVLSVRQKMVRKGPRPSNRALRVGEEDHVSYIGSKKGLIILANFNNKKFFDYSEQDDGRVTQMRYDDIANLVGYTNDYGAIGSVHDYYYNQSYGKFDLTFDVVGPVNLNKSYSYYGGGDDVNAPIMIKECCMAVDSLVNFADYDWDGDGVVEEVFVLYAGYGEATGGNRDTVWPHMWEMESAKFYYPNLDIPSPFVLDNVRINVYACSNELSGSYGTTQLGLGVICHEFSHCLGLPDLYDTSTYGTNFGMDSWDILDQGSYNGPSSLGWVPAGYSCYERWYAGWMKPSEMKKSRRIVNQKPINEKGQCYIIYNDNCKDEYYILENRNKTDWDAYLPGEGLLIVHVDYDADQWANNSVNATDNSQDHERLTIFHASNSRYGGHDAYPYQTRDSLTDNSTPSAMLYNKNTDGSKLMHKPITEITRDPATAKISFLYRNENEQNGIEEAEAEVASDAGVYRLDGIKVSGNYQNGELGGLPKGTYVVRDADGKSRKVEVK